ncbi:MAG TPA: hypothetical protein VHB21_19195, partial [Minicystis sp.]|nr:hypothetical protein [Minicystis sp.]
AVGPPAGAAPQDRIDGARTGRARTPLPAAVNVLWSRHLSGGIEHAPLVDASGDALVALAIPEIVKLAADGKELFRTRLGPQAAIVPPVLLGGGDLVAVTSGGLAVFVSPSGVVRRVAQLGARVRSEDASPVALRDGGFAVAAGRALLELDADGFVRARAALEERPVGALLDGPEGVIATGESGAVYVLRPPAPPRRIGTFGGQVRRGGAALADARTLLAVVDGRRLVAFDLVSGAAHVRTSVPQGATPMDGPPAVGVSGLAYVATQGGLVAGLDAMGTERVRAVVEKPPPMPAFGPGAPFGGQILFAPVDTKPSPPLVVDPEGRIAFVRATGKLGVVAPDGSVALASERVCASPIALVPAGARRLLLACRDGAVVSLGP